MARMIASTEKIAKRVLVIEFDKNAIAGLMPSMMKKTSIIKARIRTRWGKRRFKKDKKDFTLFHSFLLNKIWELRK